MQAIRTTAVESKVYEIRSSHRHMQIRRDILLNALSFMSMYYFDAIIATGQRSILLHSKPCVCVCLLCRSCWLYQFAVPYQQVRFSFWKYENPESLISICSLVGRGFAKNVKLKTLRIIRISCSRTFNESSCPLELVAVEII